MELHEILNYVETIGCTIDEDKGYICPIGYEACAAHAFIYFRMYEECIWYYPDAVIAGPKDVDGFTFGFDNQQQIGLSELTESQLIKMVDDAFRSLKVMERKLLIEEIKNESKGELQ